jgi:hypothetical protein
MFNAGQKQTVFTVCEPPPGKRWVRAVDTGMPPPEDILAPGSEKPVPDNYLVRERSMVIFLSTKKPV